MTIAKRVVFLTVGLMLAGAVSASAQPFRHVIVGPRFHAPQTANASFSSQFG